MATVRGAALMLALMLTDCSSSKLPPFLSTSSSPDAGEGADAATGDAGASLFAAPRTTEDQPDDAPGEYQLHALYVEPSDRDAAPRLDENGALRRTIVSFNRWLGARTGGPKLRVDTHNGTIDVTYVKLDVTEVELAQGLGEAPGAEGPRHIHERLDALLRPKFADPKKLYLVYYDGLAIGTCGDSPLGSHTAMSYVGGIWHSSFLQTAADANATTLDVYDPVATNLPAPPFPAHLGSEAVLVTNITGNRLTLGVPLKRAHPATELLLSDNRPGDCRKNPFSRDGAEFTYATFVGMHEIAHALGIVSPAAPEHAPPPIAPGHLGPNTAAGLNDLMYQGVANGRCGDTVSTAENSPCQLDPAHKNYFMLPADSPLVDLAKSVFLAPSPPRAVTPPNW